MVERLEKIPVVVITGARQTGKTTLVQNPELGKSRLYMSLDSLLTLDRARREPEILVGQDRALTIDEVQRVPDLLLEIKRQVDRDRTAGRFLLTGSANLLLMKSIGESLAGRAIYMTLRPLTLREKRQDIKSWPWDHFLSSKDIHGFLHAPCPVTRFDWKKEVMEGGFPPAVLSGNRDLRSLWLEGYVDTYVQRDLRDLSQVGDLGAFTRLMKLASLRNGGLLNQSELGRDAMVNRSTCQRWLSILKTSFLITLLQPFFETRSKRLIKSEKIYCSDTGLGLFLAGISDEEELSRCPNPGVWLENLVLNDLLVWRETRIKKPGIYYWRTASGLEVDLVIEDGRRLLPLEIKAAGSPRVADAKALDIFCQEHPARSPFGVLLYTGEETVQLTRTALAVPLGAVL